MRIDKQNFEYFFSAMLYCLWLRENKSTEIIQKYTNRFLDFILKYLFSKKIQEKCNQNRRQGQLQLGEINDFMNIEWAKNWLVFAYLSYTCVFSFIISALLVKKFGDLDYEIVLIITFIPIVICYPMLDNVVFKHDIYLNYFKQFKKEDEQWLKKWKRRTLLFQLGSVLAIIIGGLSMFIICGIITF